MILPRPFPSRLTASPAPPLRWKADPVPMAATMVQHGTAPIAAPLSPPPPSQPQPPTSTHRGRPTRAHPNAVLAIIGIGAATTLALWWHDTPAIHGLGDWLTNAG